MAKSLVLHIGDPKTGTSSIQAVLRHGMFQSPQVSVAYPDQLNSFPLANALSDPKQAEFRTPRYTRLNQWLESSDADVAVVSAEQFFRVKPQAVLDALTEFSPDLVADMRVVAYVRPHAGRFVSAFMQRAKAGLFLGSMESFLERTRAENLLQFAPRFQRWRDVFGDRFTLRPMIRSQLRDGDVVADFLDLVVKGAPFTLQGTVEANASLPLQQLAGLREVQAILKRNGIANGTRHAVGDHVGRNLSRQWPDAGTKLQMSEALYQQIKALCESDAQALDDTFFHAPLMQQALDDAGTEAVATPQDNAVGAHHSEDTVIALRKAARQLVSMFKKRPAAWTIAFEREIGQRIGGADIKPPPPPVRLHIERVNEALDGIAELIGNAAPAKGN